MRGEKEALAVMAVPVRQRVVEIEADLGEASSPRWRYGSGLLIGGRWVLTAAHVVAGAVAVMVRGTDKARLVADLDGAMVGDPARLDLALFRVPGAQLLGDIPVAIASRDLPGGEVIDGCWAVGYPEFAEIRRQAGTSIRKTEQVRGYIAPLSGLGVANDYPDLLSLEVTATPRALPSTSLDQSEWSGMSGAAVFAGSYLLGVVSEHAPRRGVSSISVTPLEDLRLPATEPDAASQWWGCLGADPEHLPAVPSIPGRPEPAYRATLRVIRNRAGTLVGREQDLDRISAYASGEADAFGLPADEHGYVWLVAAPRAGKTSLLAEAVHHLALEVDVAAFFLEARESRTSQQDFLAAVVPQLAFLLDEDAPAVINQDTFRALWERAADRAEAEDRRLLLVVDGLEQEDQVGASVAAVLPERLGSNARVLVASRPFPGMPGQVELPADVAPQHPLRAAAAYRIVLADDQQRADAAQADASVRGRFGDLLEGLDVVARDAVGGLERFLGLYADRPGAPVAFGGRDESLAALNQWLADPAVPYALMVAPAGRGKSALLARWSVQVAEEGIDVAFVPLSVRFHTASEAHAITLLGARLRHLVGRAGAPPSSLMAWADELQATLTKDRPDSRPLVVILDGIDEAVGWDLPEALLFPEAPGQGIKVLVSARELADRDISAWRSVLNWDWPVPVTEIPLSPLDADGITAVFRSLGVGHEDMAEAREVIGQVVRLSEGDPLLVRLYAESLRESGQNGSGVSVGELPQLPPGLMGFFKQWWRDQERQWGANRPLREARVRTLLAVLASALGPVEVDDVLAVAGGEPADGLSLYDAMEPLKRFVVGDGREQGWIFSHPRLGYYFREVLGKAESARWAGRFTTYGAAVAEELLAGRRTPNEAPAYIVRSYASHLRSQSAPVEQFDPLATPQWLQAWQTLEGGPDGFSADLLTAQRYFAQVLRDSPEESRRAAAIARQARFALIGSAIASLAGNIPAALIRRLLAAGAWTQEHALAYVRRMVDDRQRAAALGGLTQDQPSLAGDALEIISSIQDPDERVYGIRAVAEWLPKNLHPRALRIIDGLAGDADKGAALSALAPHLEDAALDEAITLASALRRPTAVAATYAALAARAQPLQQNMLLDRALEVARNAPDAFDQALSLQVIAGAMPVQRAEPAWAEFLDAIPQVSSASYRSWTLDSGPDLPESLLRRIPALLHGFLEDRDRAGVLSAFAPRLSEAEARRALEDLASLPDPGGYQDTLAAFSSVRWAPVLRDALAMARSASDHYSIGETVGALAGGLAALGFADEGFAEVLKLPSERLPNAMKRMAPYLPSSLIDAAVTATLQSERSGEKVSRSVAIAALAERLAQFGRIDDALARAGAIETPSYRLQAVCNIAPYLDGEALERAIAIVLEPSEEQERSWALDALSQRLMQLGHPQRALDLIENIGHPEYRLNALSAISSGLPTELLGHAEAATQLLSDELEQGRTLAALLPRIAEEHRAEPYAAALEVVMALPRSTDQHTVLQQLMPSAPPECIQATINAVLAIREPNSRWLALVDFLPRMVELGAVSAALQVAREINSVIQLVALLPAQERMKLIGEAAQEARRIRLEFSRATALAWLSTVTSGDASDNLLAEALDTARKWPDGWRHALTHVVALLPAERRGPLIEEAIAAAQGIPNETLRANTLLKLASVVGPEDSAKLGEEALDAIAQMPENRRGMSIGYHAAELPAASLDHALALADAISDQLWAGNALRGLIPALAAAGRPEEALTRALTAQPSGQDDMLAGMGPHLPEPLLKRALVAADELEPYYRGIALAGLAPRLATAGHPIQALELITQIPPADKRSAALGLVSPALAALPTVELAPAWSRALRALSTGHRKELLTDIGSLAEVIAALGGPNAVHATAAALVAVCTWIK